MRWVCRRPTGRGPSFLPPLIPVRFLFRLPDRVRGWAPSPLFLGRPLPLPLQLRSLPRPGGQFLVVLDDLLRHLVVRLQDLLLARRERAHPATPVFLPRRLVRLEVETPVVDDAEEILPQVEAVSAEHRPAAYL